MSVDDLVFVDMPISEADNQIEMLLIGCMIVDPKIIDRVSVDLQGSEFNPVTKIGDLYDVLVSAHYAKGYIGDKSLVNSVLENSSLEPTFKTKEFLYKLFKDACPGNWGYFVARIKQLHLLRTMHMIGESLKIKTKSDSDPNKIKTWLDGEIAKIGLLQKTKSRTLDECAAKVMHELKSKTRFERGVMTGFPGYDQMVGPLMGGELAILAARPGMGKTAMAMQIARNCFMKDEPVLFVSLEMTAEELTGRLLASCSGVNGRSLRTGDASDEAIKKLSAAQSDLLGVPLDIYDPPQRGSTVPVIGAMCKQAISKRGKLSLLVVDYIGIVAAQNPSKFKRDDIAEITGGLKSLAKELRIPVLALCQLSRDADTGRPTLSSLADSASIERDADVVMFLWRENFVAPETEFIVAKHRHASVGTLNINWIANKTEYFDPSTPVTGTQWDY